MKISHVNKFRMPNQLWPGQFHCDDDEHYSLLRPHIECDFIIHCLNYRDEAQCKSSQKECAGGVKIGRKR